MDYQLASMIDHTLLKANATREVILQICEEAKEYRTASVCVNSYWASTVHEALKGSGVMTCCVVGFPLGAMSTEAKAFETKEAVKDGAEEIDMVINIGLARVGEWDALQEDIAAVVKAAGNAAVKVIIEACLLTDDEKVKACVAAQNAGAAFVKTSTGFSSSGATVEDIKLMRETVGPNMGVKAAGGIRSRETALAMIRAGANRVGASATQKLIEE